MASAEHVAPSLEHLAGGASSQSPEFNLQNWKKGEREVVGRGEGKGEGERGEEGMGKKEKPSMAHALVILARERLRQEDPWGLLSCPPRQQQVPGQREAISTKGHPQEAQPGEPVARTQRHMGAPLPTHTQRPQVEPWVLHTLH